MQPESRREWGAATHYDAFVSYSHGSDGAFAPGFQQRLEAFARRGRVTRALRVFRDDANLAANPNLWHGIEQALASSTWLVLLASPQAAESPWVGKEIEWWLRNRSVERILIGLTSGHLAWDGDAGGFDAASTIHPALRGVLAAEPRWIDLRAVRALPKLDDDDPRVQEALAEFAAPLRGVEKDQLIGEHIRRQRRDKRRVRIALVVFMVLFLVALTAGVLAFVQGRLATEEARVATARLLAATAVRTSPSDAARANLLASEGYRLHRDSQTVAALFQVVNDNPELVGQHTLTAPVTALTASSGVVLAGTADGRLVRWDPGSGRGTEVRMGARGVTDVAINEDGTVAAATDGQRAVVWHADEEPVVLEQERPGQVALSPRGTTAVVLTAPDAPPQRLTTFDAATGTRRGGVEITDLYLDGLGMPDEQTVAVANGGLWRRLGLTDLVVTVRQDEPMLPPSRGGLATTSDNGSFTGFYAGWATVFDTSTAEIDPSLSGIDSPYTADVFAIRDDGERIAVGGGGQLFVADVGGMDDQYNPVELHGAGGAQRVAFMGDSDRLVTAEGATLSLWDPAQRSRLRLDTDVLKVPETPDVSDPTRMAVSPDGRSALLVGGYDEVVVHDLRGGSAEGRTVTPPDGEATFPAWLADGTPALIGKVGCDLFAVRGSKIETLLEGAGVANLAARLTPDGQHLICVDEYGGVTVRRLGDGMYVNQVPGQDEKLTEFTGFSEVGLAAISEDGRYAARIAGHNDDGTGALTVVDLQEGRTTTVAGDAMTVDFAGDRLLVSYADGSLEVRDPSGSALLRTIAGGTAFARPLSWVPGTPFVGRIREDGAVVVFDVDTGATLGVLTLPLGKATTDRHPWQATAITGATGELMTATPAGSIVRWAVSERAWLDLACQFAGRDLRPEEWRDVTGSEPPADLSCRR